MIFFGNTCTRALGNLALKRLWIHFIKAKAFYLDSEREKEAILLEEMLGNQELTDFYDLVNSLVLPSPKEHSKVVQMSASKAFHRALNPVKSMTLNVSVGGSSQEDSVCEVNNPLQVADSI